MTQKTTDAMNATDAIATSEVSEAIAPSSADSSQPSTEESGAVEGQVPVSSSDGADLSEERLAAGHPRKQIRSYLRTLFSLLGAPLPAAWPKVDLAGYSEHRHVLRERLDQLYSYLEGQIHFTLDQRLMPRYMGETAMYLYELDYDQPEMRHQPPQDLVELLSDRPAAITDFDQLYCTPDSTERRVQRILRDFGDSDAKICFLGDDDLGSVALAPHFSGEIHMIDLDERLHEYVARKAPQVIRHKADFIYDGIDRALCETFDAVVLDPPWDFYRLWCFLDKALYCLKQDPHARIYLSYCPLVLEHRLQMLAQFQKRVAQRCLTFDSIETAFNLYSLSMEDFPDIQERLAPHIPSMESPLLDLLRELPFVHTQLYVLRRLPNVSMGRIRRTFFHWWNRASTTKKAR